MKSVKTSKWTQDKQSPLGRSLGLSWGSMEHASVSPTCWLCPQALCFQHFIPAGAQPGSHCSTDLGARAIFLKLSSAILLVFDLGQFPYFSDPCFPLSNRGSTATFLGFL